MISEYVDVTTISAFANLGWDKSDDLFHVGDPTLWATARANGHTNTCGVSHIVRSRFPTSPLPALDTSDVRTPTAVRSRRRIERNTARKTTTTEPISAPGQAGRTVHHRCLPEQTEGSASARILCVQTSSSGSVVRHVA